MMAMNRENTPSSRISFDRACVACTMLMASETRVVPVLLRLL